MTSSNTIVSKSNIPGNQARSSNIELLRIISMFLICLHHFCLFSNFQWTSMTPGLFTVQCLSIGGKVGVSIFILITGYFLVNQHISARKVIRFYLQVFFYSISLYLLMKCVFHQPITGDDLRVALMPISNNSYWFATSYLMIYVCSPVLNIFIKSLSKKVHFLLVFLSVSIWILWYLYNVNNFNYSEFLWMIILYLTGAYIRLYPPQRFANPLRNTGYVILLLSSACLTMYVFNSVNTQYYTNVVYFLNLNNFFIFSISLVLFLLFVNIRIPSSKFINTLASAAFGVYLIHENNYVRFFLWTKVFPSGKFQESPYLIPYAIGVSLLVLAVFSVVDLIRKFLLEKPVMKLIDTFGPRIAVPFLHIRDAIWKRIYIDKTGSPE